MSLGRKLDSKTQQILLDLGLLFMRVAAGLMIAFAHGWRKLTSWSEMSESFADPLGVGSQVSLALAIFGEFVCGLLVVLGIATRLTAIPTAVTMLVAGLIYHADDPFETKELALLFSVAFITLVFTGAGRFSVDGMLSSRNR